MAYKTLVKNLRERGEGDAADTIEALLAERKALIQKNASDAAKRGINSFYTQCTDCYCKDPMDYIRIALAIQTLAYHDKNFLWTGNDAKISEVTQFLLAEALMQRGKDNA